MRRLSLPNVGAKTPTATIKLTGGAKPPQTLPNLAGGAKLPQTPPDGKKNFRGRDEIEWNFNENFGFRRKSRISAKISDFGENFGFGRKFRISVKILDFGENLGFR